MTCIADSDKIRVIASLSDPIDEVFPYLNAVIKNITYNHKSKIVVLKRGYRLITIYSDMVTMAKIDDEQDAVRIMQWIQETTNRVWEQRHEITPLFQQQQLLRPLDVYGLLPKTNCKLCGESTCFAFACALLAGTRNIDQCSPLDQSQYAKAKDYLWSTLIADDMARI
ncbi:(Fe-S)-binding protein [Chloroflexota bacterium]